MGPGGMIGDGDVEMPPQPPQVAGYGVPTAASSRPRKASASALKAPPPPASYSIAIGKRGGGSGGANGQPRGQQSQQLDPEFPTDASLSVSHNTPRATQQAQAVQKAAEDGEFDWMPYFYLMLSL